MNRKQRRDVKFGRMKQEDLSVVEQDLDETGKDFVSFAKDNNVDMNAFFRMFSAWMHLSQPQKQAVIVYGITNGLIDMENTNEKHDSEGK